MLKPIVQTTVTASFPKKSEESIPTQQFKIPKRSIYSSIPEQSQATQHDNTKDDNDEFIFKIPTKSIYTGYK